MYGYLSDKVTVEKITLQVGWLILTWSCGSLALRKTKQEYVMDKCEHVVAMLGGKFINEKDFSEVVATWVESVKYYNENTLRIAIQPPAELTTSEYCPHCGVKLDRASKEKIITESLEERGDGRDVYDSIYKEKNRPSK